MSGRFSSKIIDRNEFKKRNDLEHHLSPKELKYIKDTFKENDAAGTGELDLDQLIEVLNSYGIDTNDQSLQDLFNDAEKNGSTGIDFDQFIDIITSKLSDIDSANIFAQFFNLFLGDENIDKIEKRHIKKYCPTLKSEEIDEMLQKADTDKDGKINFEDFYNIITKKI